MLTLASFVHVLKLFITVCLTYTGGQVSTLSAIDNYLYIGTTRGSVLVTEATTLIPLCLFQCHSAQEFYIRTILPVMPVLEDCRSRPEEDSGKEEEESDRSRLRVPAVVTVGKGYTNILKVCQFCIVGFKRLSVLYYSV